MLTKEEEEMTKDDRKRWPRMIGKDDEGDRMHQREIRTTRCEEQERENFRV